MRSKGSIGLSTLKRRLETYFDKKPLKTPSNLGNYDLAKIWKTYFNTTCCMGFCPFKIVDNQDGRINLLQFKCKFSGIQRILCGLLLLFVMVFSYNDMIQYFRFRGLEVFTNDKSGFFFLLGVEIIQFAFPILIFRELWLNQRAIIHIMNYLVDPFTCMPRATNRSILKVKMLMLVGFLIVCVGELVVEHFLLFYDEGSVKYWNSMCFMGCQCLFLDMGLCLVTDEDTIRQKVLASIDLVGNSLW